MILNLHRGGLWMSDIDDDQIKEEIDGIMNGVKTIMEKIDALTPKEELEQGQVEDAGGNPNASDNSNTAAS
jgi:hypothetical protein